MSLFEYLGGDTTHTVANQIIVFQQVQAGTVYLLIERGLIAQAQIVTKEGLQKHITYFHNKDVRNSSEVLGFHSFSIKPGKWDYFNEELRVGYGKWYEFQYLPGCSNLLPLDYEELQALIIRRKEPAKFIISAAPHLISEIAEIICEYLPSSE